MKKVWMILLALLIVTAAPACSPDEDPAPEVPEQPEVPDGNEEKPEKPEEPGDNVESMKIRMTVGITIFTATLTDNETGKAFRAMLPLSLDMSELNNNEKYAGLSQSLPTAAVSPGTIHAGDLMLYGSSTLVVFYKTFLTSYSYTRIGSIDNPSGLESALGAGNVTIRFEIIEN